VTEAPSITSGGDFAPAEPDADEMADGNDERDSFEAYADAAGIPDAKRDSAFSALQSLIESCVAKAKAGSYGEE
jgi:hypothetical protein